MIPDSVTSIGPNAFIYCKSLESVRIPDSVTSIGPEAFSHCENLTSVTMSDSVESIGRDAFEGCKHLKSVKLPRQLRSIHRNLFEGCSSLESVVIPPGVTNIASGAFRRCPSLKSISIPDSVDDISDDAFDETCRLEKSEKRRDADRLAVIRKAEAQFAALCEAGNGTAEIYYDGINYLSIETIIGTENFVVMSCDDNPNDYAYSIMIFPETFLRVLWYEAVVKCTEKVKDWIRIAAEHKVASVCKEIPIYAEGRSDKVRAFVTGITQGKGQDDLMRRVIRQRYKQLAEQCSVEQVKFIGLVKAEDDFKSYSISISVKCGDIFNSTIFERTGTMEKINEEIVEWLTIVDPISLENARKAQSRKEDLFH